MAFEENLEPLFVANRRRKLSERSDLGLKPPKNGPILTPKTAIFGRAGGGLALRHEIRAYVVKDRCGRRVSTPKRDAPLPLAARPESHAARDRRGRRTKRRGKRHGKRRVSTPKRDAPLPLAARPESHAARA